MSTIGIVDTIWKEIETEMDWLALDSKMHAAVAYDAESGFSHSASVPAMCIATRLSRKGLPGVLERRIPRGKYFLANIREQPL